MTQRVRDTKQLIKKIRQLILNLSQKGSKQKSNQMSNKILEITKYQ